MPRKKNLEKQLAEGMFVEQGMTAEAIAEVLKVQPKTVGAWRKEGDWDRLRDENLASPHKIRAILLREMKVISEGKPSKIDADALSKISKVMDTISDKLSPQLVIMVLKAFDNYMADQEPKTAVLFLEWHKRFIQHIISLHDD